MTSNRNSLVSTIIPVYNRPIGIIVVDDDSIDQPIRQIGRLCREYPDIVRVIIKVKGQRINLS